MRIDLCAFSPVADSTSTRVFYRVIYYKHMAQSTGMIIAEKNAFRPALGMFLGLILYGCATAPDTNSSANENLISAAKMNDLIEARIQINKGADVNSEDEYGITPLIAAAFYGHLEMAELLLNNGADVNAHKSSDYPPLAAAILQDRESVVKLLLSSGANVNIRLGNGRTPLHLAVFDGCEDIVELLIAHGALVNVKDDTGITPLHDAVANRNRKLVELLLANGADIRAKDNDGTDPLMLSRHTDLYAILKAGHANKPGVSRSSARKTRRNNGKYPVQPGVTGSLSGDPVFVPAGCLFSLQDAGMQDRQDSRKGV